MERCVKLFGWQAYSQKTGFYAINKFLFAFFLSFCFLNKASFFFFNNVIEISCINKGRTKKLPSFRLLERKKKIPEILLLHVCRPIPVWF